MALESYNLKDKIDAQRILLNLLNHVYSLNPRLLFLLDIYRNHFRTQNPNKIPYKVKKISSTTSWFRKKERKGKKLRNIRCTRRIKTRDKNRTPGERQTSRLEHKTDSPRAIKFALVSVYKPPGERITGFFASINRILEREKFLDNRWSMNHVEIRKLSIRVATIDKISIE